LIILGVDPGSMRTGYGVIESDGRRHRLVEKGVLVTPRRASLADRLQVIHKGLSGLIDRVHPEIMAVEDLFHSVNTRTVIVLAHVRGVILQAGAAAGIPIHEFPPTTVKVQVTGFGHAEKAQVALMVSRLLRLTDDAQAGDATDALAVALCHAHLHVSGAA
jgi:crossover junction endodeoxyribonuclease RuvC